MFCSPHFFIPFGKSKKTSLCFFGGVALEFGAKARTAIFLWRLMEGRKDPAVLPMCTQKKPFPPCCEESSRLPRSTPEEEGVDSKQLEAFVAHAAADKGEDIHSVTVLRHGKVILERSLLPYDREVWHVTHSLCKTVTSLAVGICIGDGLLHIEDRAADFFPDIHTASWYKNLTVFHLLTMTSGAAYNEVRSVTEQDWVHGFLNSPLLFPVGEKFHYNSMNSYMLSAIVSAVTGETMSSFLHRRLFAPMGIHRFHWETCPSGIEKGGWGLYLLQEDAAKLGQLILNRGAWNGKQLVPGKYIRDMCLWHSDPPEKLSRSGYGYQCWLWEREHSVRLSGLFGQTVLVVPDKDIVLAVNAGSGRMFGEASYMREFAAFLENGVFEAPLILKSLPALQNSNLIQKRYAQKCYGRDESIHQYEIRKGVARLLPVFIQICENNYTKGIDCISFQREGTRLYILFSEGETINKIEVGFTSPVVGRITANGETYLAACSGKWERKGAVPRLSIKLCFLEQASTRYIEFIFETKNAVRVKLCESPDRKALIDGISLLFDDERTVNVLSKGRIANRFKMLCEPEIYGVCMKKAVPEFSGTAEKYSIKGEGDRVRLP